MKPAAVLVGSFQVKIGREFALLAFFKHSRKTCAGIKPHIQNVAVLAPSGRAAFGAGKPFRNKVLYIRLIPVITAGGVTCIFLRNCIGPFRVVPGGVTAFTNQGDNRDAPNALA